MRSTLRRRALSKIRIDLDGPRLVDDSPCWIWTASIDRNGYGQIAVADGKGGLAHRVVYELLHAPIPAGLTLDHLCRVRCCVNPAHLEPVTHAENTRRGESFAAVNNAKAFCDNGHEFTPENTYLYAGSGQKRRGRGHKRRICRACDREKHRVVRAS